MEYKIESVLYYTSPEFPGRSFASLEALAKARVMACIARLFDGKPLEDPELHKKTTEQLLDAIADWSYYLKTQSSAAKAV